MTDSHDTTLITAWLTALAEADHAPATIRRYTSVLRQFTTWFVDQEQRPLTAADLTPFVLVSYRNDLQTHTAASTVHVHVCALRAWCRWLADAQIIQDNSAVRLRRVAPPPPGGPRSLTGTHLNALIREVERISRHPARDSAIVQILIQTGLRVSECAALTYADVTLAERSGSLLIRHGKGRKMRVVPLNSSARQALATYLAPLLAVDATVKAVAAVWPSCSTTGIWRSQKGSRLTDSAIRRTIDQAVASAAQRGLVPPQTSPHTLRHTFATHYLQDHPGDLVGLATLLGHVSIQTTMRYVAATEEELAHRVEHTHLNAFG